MNFKGVAAVAYLIIVSIGFIRVIERTYHHFELIGSGSDIVLKSLSIPTYMKLAPESRVFAFLFWLACLQLVLHSTE